MSETNERTLEQVTAEHNNLCYRAGMLNYRIEVETQEVKQIYQELFKLNQEAAKINEINQKAEALKKKEDSKLDLKIAENANTSNTTEAANA